MRSLVIALALAALAGVAVPVASASATSTEVVVTLDAPSLARAVKTSRVLTDTVKRRRLDLSSATSRGYLRELARAQRQVERRIVGRIPSASVRWRYRVVTNGLAVVLPAAKVGQLATIDGIRRMYPGAAYGTRLNDSTKEIGANAMWGLPSLSTAGNGVKIGIIDTGIDPRLPFFNPAGYAYPPGFPKGNRDWTTPKVIVARGFGPANATGRYARAPYDPQNSDHGDHVAGIAAGNHGVRDDADNATLSGVAPRAYLGNYKVFSTVTPDFGLIENSAEVVAAIESAVRDGMDVINLSLGEYEVNPARNLVDAAIDAAADAGVVSVSAAGNSYGDLGQGSIGSPGTAAKGIAVAAVTKSGRLAGFSSRGPTAISLRMKPDVSAPGVSILSSVPVHEGTWSYLSGTSMAAPHVAGAAALLIQRHPDWTVAEIKSALTSTGKPVLVEPDSAAEVPANAQGGGLIELPAANDPLLFTLPSAVSFGLVRAGRSADVTVAVSDAGGGAGSWNVSARLQSPPDGVILKTPTTVSVPGPLELTLRSEDGAEEGDLTGFVVLRRGATTRRIPFWSRITRPRLGAPARVLTKPGLYAGNTDNGSARVASYRYPDDPAGLGVSNDLPGPERVFRVRVAAAAAANFGVRVVSVNRGVAVSPRLVAAADENRLLGVPALPVDVNPYRDSYGESRGVVAALVPARGLYDVVFDTVSRARSGRFTFRLWINDHTPPKATVRTRTTDPVGDVRIAVSDTGSGVDPRSARAWIDGISAPVSVRGNVARVMLDGTKDSGTHRLVFQISDFQELKNSENTAGFLPNTRVLRTTFRVR